MKTRVLSKMAYQKSFYQDPSLPFSLEMYLPAVSQQCDSTHTHTHTQRVKILLTDFQILS